MKHKYGWVGEVRVHEAVSEPLQDQGFNIRSYDRSWVRICSLSLRVTLDKLFKSVNPSESHTCVL